MRKFTGRQLADHAAKHLPESFTNEFRQHAGKDRQRRFWQPTQHPVGTCGGRVLEAEDRLSAPESLPQGTGAATRRLEVLVGFVPVDGRSERGCEFVGRGLGVRLREETFGRFPAGSGLDTCNCMCTQEYAALNAPLPFDTFGQGMARSPGSISSKCRDERPRGDLRSAGGGVGRPTPSECSQYSFCHRIYLILIM